MKFERPKTKSGHEIISPSEFKQRLDIDVSTNTLSYQFFNETIDYCQIGKYRFIVWNDKAKNFKLDSRGRKKLK